MKLKFEIRKDLMETRILSFYFEYELKFLPVPTPTSKTNPKKIENKRMNERKMQQRKQRKTQLQNTNKDTFCF